MIRRILLLTGLNFFLFNSLIGQKLNFPLDITFNQSLFTQKLNPYTLSNNPALLNFDEEDELLHINSSLNSRKGNFKSTFEPELNNLYSITFSGKKSLGNSQIFKGYFSFLKDERKNWLWIFSKNYETGNPFLLGDYSAGYSRFNAISMRASYFRNLTEKFSIGTTLNYFVDEGLKNVSPRPTSNHRDVSFQVGLAYELFNDFINAVSLKFSDSQEEIDYKEDEGSVLKEISLMKFRGFDFPVIINKKTETRIVYENSYEFNYDLYYLILKNLSVGLTIQSGIFQSISKEDLYNPNSQGYFQRSYSSQIVMIDYQFHDKLTSQILCSNYSSDYWAKHPDYNILLSDNSYSRQTILLKASYILSPNSSFQLKTGLEKFSFDLNDFYSNVSSTVRSYSYLIGLDYYSQLSERIKFNINYNFRLYSPSEKSLAFNKSSIFFTNYFRNDFLLIQSRSIEHLIFSNLEYKSIFGIFTINYTGSLLKSLEENKNHRINTTLSLGYKVKVY